MDTKKRNILIGAAAGVLVLIVGVVIFTGVLRGFDPKNYVEAVLNQSLKGDAAAAAQMMEETSKKDLEKQYEAGIQSFVKNSIANGVELDAKLEEKYVVLCKKIFSDMKYSVKSAKDIKGGGYEVTVSYQSSDVFTNFAAAVSEEGQRLIDKVEDGVYRGTKEEINAQMHKDIFTNAYEQLAKSYENAKYGEEKTCVFEIQKDEAGKYGMNGTQISEFIAKLLNLDENQG